MTFILIGYNMKKSALVYSLLFLMLLAFNLVPLHAGDVTIIDSRHYSNVFGEMRNYRIFLPPGYNENPQKRYPVIYFLHGWSQRYFGIGPVYSDPYEEGDDNKGDNIANFVSAHDVIVVKSDGYNRNPDEEYYLRPYNIGSKKEVETYRQFPIYYPELVNFIDATYKTIPDREHRAISGLSMGGFMTYWIGGKYPQLFSAAGNFCGSAEFFVGPRAFPVEYSHSYMFKNYGGMKVRLNYGNKDFIRSYHEDVNRVWTQVMDNYEFKIYDAAHSTCGLGDMFGFLLNTFKDPPKKPLKWAHIDVYPEFTVWEYNVNTDRNVPGFTVLENVDKRGFRCSVREFLPDGELLPFVNVTVTTPPIYEANQKYIVNDLDSRTLKSVRNTIMSDNTGRLKISIDGSIHEIGINRLQDKPNICLASFKIENMDWVTSGKDVILSIRLLNKGSVAGKNIRAKLSATRSTTEIIKNESFFGNIGVSEIKLGTDTYNFKIRADSIEMVQFRLTVNDDQKNEWNEFFEIPVRRDLPEITDFVISDGRTFTVSRGGTDTETTVLGTGNGDGVANPGESIVILVKDHGTFRRTNLVFSDKYVNPFGINHRKSDEWSDFDHVGASNKYSVPLIASDCPDGHTLDFFAEYWLPDYPCHIIKQGKIKIQVKGKDTTSPELCWVQIPGDNIIRAKLSDGSRIQSVKAKLILRTSDEPEKSFYIELNDNGLNGDLSANDNVFSAQLPRQKLGFYRILLEATDSFGNTLIAEPAEKYFLH
jgi:S-formylglutathione hydrolase FrmB